MSYGYVMQLKNIIRSVIKTMLFSLGEPTVSYRKADKYFVKKDKNDKTRQVAIKLQDLSR